jgi:hypothetical protein
MRHIVISTLLLCSFLASPTRPDGFLTSRYSGTVVAVAFDKDRIIVAADSRELQDPDPPFDKACKIVPLSNQMFFASLGFQSGADQTNTRRTFGSDLAHKAFDQFKSMPNTDSRTEKVAERWGDLMRRPIQDYVDHHPYFPGLGQDAAYGVFGSASGGEFFIYTESIYYPDPPRIPLLSPHPQVWADDVPQPLTGKEGDEFSLGPASQEVDEFFERKTQRAVAANVKFDNAVRDAKQNREKPDVLAMKMKISIETAEKWDQITIGGDVDVLELERNGSLKWIYVKQQCKTQY